MAAKDAMVEPTAGRSRGSFMRCLRLTPWLTFFSAALFVTGLVLWAVSAVKTKDYSLQFADELGAKSDSTAMLGNIVNTAIIAIGITGIVAVALVLIIAFMRTAQRSMLWGGCCCRCDRPEPWMFTTYCALNGLLTMVMWFLLLALVMLLMGMLLWMGAALVVEYAIQYGTQTADEVLPNGIFDAASNLSNSLLGVLNPVLPDAASAVASGSMCPPVCLNFGSFGVVLNLESSCLCGTERLDNMQRIANDAITTSAIALAGATAMYMACSFLLMLLTAHQVTASYDRKSVRALNAQDAAAYEQGTSADPRDCMSAPMSRTVSMGEAALPVSQPPVTGAPLAAAAEQPGNYQASRYSAYV